MEAINNPMDSMFQVVPVDEETTINGYTYSASQRAIIQNLIVGYAHDHLNIRYDPDKPHLAAIEQAAIKGAISALQHLLDAHSTLHDARHQSNEDQE